MALRDRRQERREEPQELRPGGGAIQYQMREKLVSIGVDFCSRGRPPSTSLASSSETLPPPWGLLGIFIGLFLDIAVHAGSVGVGRRRYA